MNKQQLASKIWESANKMRSKIDANDYKDYILGFMFYKFLSDKEVRFAKEKGFTEKEIKDLTEEKEEERNFIRTGIGYFISYNNLFSTWIDKGQDFEVGNVRDALSAFDRLINPSYKKVFDGIFKTLQNGLSKLGGTALEQTKSVRDLIQLLKIIPMNGKQDYDVLGFIYEYLISNFAVNAGKKAGEFYTPHEVSILMSDIIADHLKNEEEIKIYDPTSGSGSLLINIGESLSKHITRPNSVKYYAQELKENTYNLTRMNLVVRGILPDNIVVRNADTLENDWPYFDESDPVGTYDPLYVNAVVSNPPYSQSWIRDKKESDPRYAGYGLAPNTKADYAFLLHDLYHVKPNGIMTIVLPHGVLFRGGEEGEIRKNLIEKNKIDAIIGLPANTFFGTGIPTIIMVLKPSRTHNDILIVDASKYFIKDGNKNKLSSSDIKRITDTVIDTKNIEKYSRLVSLDEIRNNEYNLNITRYVDSSESSESWDLYSLMFGGIPKKEIDSLNKHWTTFPSLKNELFKDVNNSYSSLRQEDVKSVIINNGNIKDYFSNYRNKFSSFNKYLEKQLIEDIKGINISSAELVIGKEIFSRMIDFILIDRYKAYQALDNEWTKIAIDLEIIQTEGLESIKIVDPNIVIKKKDNKEEEVQDGWSGRILPFKLVQSKILYSEQKSIELKELRLSEISASLQEILDSFSEEEKELIWNEEKVKVDEDEAKKQIKDLNKEKQENNELFKNQLKKYDTLLKEEKELRRSVKKETDELHLLTKKAIESLSDDTAVELLKVKWIAPIVNSLDKLPEEITNYLVNRIQYLKEKYNITFSEIENGIDREQNKLLDLVDELEGDEFDMKGLSELKSLLKSK